MYDVYTAHFRLFLCLVCVSLVTLRGGLGAAALALHNQRSRRFVSLKRFCKSPVLPGFFVSVVSGQSECALNLSAVLRSVEHGMRCQSVAFEGCDVQCET